ncbi:MAG: hypothetical protein ACPGXK_03050, partial [Phycisphaerae bacterium]
MLRTWMEFFPWSMDESIDATLDHLRGEVGLDGLTIPVATEPVRHLSARSQSLMHETSGGLIYPPQSEHYPDTRIKPLVADWAGQRNNINPWKSACEERGLELRLSLATARMGRMAERYPALAVKNIGDSRCRKTLCLANTEVQALLLDLVLELVDRFSPDSIELVGFSSTWQFDGTEVSPISASPGWQDWWKTCVCESCRQRAMDHEIDVVRAVALLEEGAVNALRGTGQAPAVSIDSQSPLGQYLNMQIAERIRLLDRLSQKSRVPIICRIPSTGFHDLPRDSIIDGSRSPVSWIIDQTDDHPLINEAKRAKSEWHGEAFLPRLD